MVPSRPRSVKQYRTVGRLHALGRYGLQDVADDGVRRYPLGLSRVGNLHPVPQRRRRDHLESEGVAVIETYRERLTQGSEEPGPDSTVAREQLRRLIEHAVADLPDMFRSVFVLRDIEDFSVEETADALGIPAATVKTRLHRARARLQQALAPEVKSVLTGSFPFAGADCDALTDRVLTAFVASASAG